MAARAVRALVVVAFVAVLSAAGLSPAQAAAAGYNDWSCQPSDAHPNPVVLVHGLGGTDGNWSYIGPQLAAAGYCAFSLTYGKASPSYPNGGFRPIVESAEEISGFIDDVRATTGAAEVDIIGHSEGGFHSLYVPKRFGLGAIVGRVVALAPPSHGTTMSGLIPAGRTLGFMPMAKVIADLFGCQACDDLAISGSAVTELNTGPIAVAGIDYTIIASRTDVLVTPTETSFVREPGVHNILVQDLCPADPVGHIGLAFDRGVLHMITNALDPGHATPVACSVGVPF